jgi:hypothetical protein
MEKYHFHPGVCPQASEPLHRSDGTVQYLLNDEEQILRMISARSPTLTIMNEICHTLDCQIGNMVSLIFLEGEDESGADEIARSAAVFGLHIFFSASICAEDGNELGTLEMYCRVPRNPSSWEFQLIDRAACLAAIAIENGS